ncbi:MAG: hypothetical protein HKO90_03045 [Flavobacteriaceae bacterium]|nr:hypothetical protein [Flavobacteriaceae bacterium]
MNILICPTYFPNILTVASIAQADGLTLEVYGNYQKQTYRNRTLIYGANGLLTLTVPVNYTQRLRQPYSEVRISKRESWQAIHWKSLKSAYSTSPYFQYYDHYFEEFFNRPFDNLINLSIASMELLCSCLDLEISWKLTTEYQKTPAEYDLRFLADPRKDAQCLLQQYIQVFKNKHGFISNLSVLDLLFNEGPASENYLLNQDLSPLFA